MWRGVASLALVGQLSSYDVTIKMGYLDGLHWPAFHPIFFSWCPPWRQPSLIFFTLPLPFKGHPPPAHWYETSWVPHSAIFLEHKSQFLDLLISFVKSFKTLNFSKHVSHVTTWDYGITLENILKYILFLETHVIALARAGTHASKFVCAIYCTHKNIVFSLCFVIIIYFQ